MTFLIFFVIVLLLVGFASWLYYSKNVDYDEVSIVFTTADEGLNGKVMSGNEAPVLASKTGRTYRLPWCDGSKKTRPENVLTFKSAAEAEEKGYLPSKNCH